MLKDQGSARARLLLAAVALALGVGVAASAVWTVPTTDVGRDLLGAEASLGGGQPYRQIRDLVPGGRDGEEGSYWVAHTPAAVGMWVPLLAVGVDTVTLEVGLRALETLALLLLFGYLVITAPSPLVAATVAVATPLALSVRVDLSWLALEGLVAWMLIGWVAAVQRGPRWTAILLAALILAWRPWLAPVVLLAPWGGGYRRTMTAALAVTGLGTGITLLSLGGPATLGAWRHALEQNFGQYAGSPWNLSVTGPIMPGIGVIMGVAVVGVAMATGGRLGWNRVAIGVAVIAALSPLVWIHYWIPLAVVLLAAPVDHRLQGAAVAVFALHAALAYTRPGDPTASQLTSLVSVVLVVAATWRAARVGKSYPAPDEPAPAPVTA